MLTIYDLSLSLQHKGNRLFLHLYIMKECLSVYVSENCVKLSEYRQTKAIITSK